MFSAMGTEARLRIMQLLLSAHPEGLVVGKIQEELEIPNSTLSHHLDKLKSEGLVQADRVVRIGSLMQVEGCSVRAFRASYSPTNHRISIVIQTGSFSVCLRGIV